jgi:hypothetical protein
MGVPTLPLDDTRPTLLDCQDSKGSNFLQLQGGLEGHCSVFALPCLCGTSNMSSWDPLPCVMYTCSCTTWLVQLYTGLEGCNLIG